jgi:hypothetical protein
MCIASKVRYAVVTFNASNLIQKKGKIEHWSTLLVFCYIQKVIEYDDLRTSLGFL